MTELEKILSSDPDGMASYEYLVNHTDSDIDTIGRVADNIIRIDSTGQFVSSAARFLSAVGGDSFRPVIDRLIGAAIEKDRNHAYLPDLLTAVWGDDYASRAGELREKDDNFRRIYKRLYPSGAL